MEKTILVTGSRYWTDERTILLALGEFYGQEVRVMHGACRGADTIAGQIAERLGYVVQDFPANWKQFGPGAGPRRNQEMVDQEPDLVLAFHSNLAGSRGTKDCISRASKAGIPVYLYDGSNPKTRVQRVN